MALQQLCRLFFFSPGEEAAGSDGAGDWRLGAAPVDRRGGTPRIGPRGGPLQSRRAPRQPGAGSRSALSPSLPSLSSLSQRLKPSAARRATATITLPIGITAHRQKGSNGAQRPSSGWVAAKSPTVHQERCPSECCPSPSHFGPGPPPPCCQPVGAMAPRCLTRQTGRAAWHLPPAPLILPPQAHRQRQGGGKMTGTTRLRGSRGSQRGQITAPPPPPPLGRQDHATHPSLRHPSLRKVCVEARRRSFACHGRALSSFDGTGHNSQHAMTRLARCGRIV